MYAYYNEMNEEQTSQIERLRKLILEHEPVPQNITTFL